MFPFHNLGNLFYFLDTFSNLKLFHKIIIDLVIKVIKLKAKTLQISINEKSLKLIRSRINRVQG